MSRTVDQCLNEFNSCLTRDSSAREPSKRSPAARAMRTFTTPPTATWVKPGYKLMYNPSLPTQFRLKNAATGQYMIAGPSNTIAEGPGTGVVITRSSPSDLYKNTATTGMTMMRLDTAAGAIRHAGFVLSANPYVANNYDFAWKFLKKEGSNNRIIIWNPYPGDAKGMYLQGGARPKIDPGTPTEYIIEPITSGVAAAAPASVATMTGKIVRVERADGKNEYINLLGIDVFDQNGAKIAATPTLGPTTYANNPTNFGPQFLVDGVHAESGPAGLRLPHTEAQASSFMQLDFGSDKTISKIVIYNRTSCCMERINGCVLKVLNAAGATVVTIPLSGSKAVYTFSAPLTNSSTSSTYMMEGSPFVLSGYGGPGRNWVLILTMLLVVILLWILSKNL